LADCCQDDAVIASIRIEPVAGRMARAARVRFPLPNAENLAELIRSVDWPCLLGLAEDHGVTGHLAARLLQLDQDLVPPATDKRWSNASVCGFLLP